MEEFLNRTPKERIYRPFKVRKPAPEVYEPQYKPTEEVQPNPTHKIVIEVMGRDHSTTHFFKLNKEVAKPEFTAYAKNDMKARHRSVAIFNQLQTSPRNIRLSVAAMGSPSYIDFPLLENVVPVGENTSQTEWDIVIAPLRPLQYLDKTNPTQARADIVHEQFLYIWWQGKLWRELAIDKHGLMKDIRVNWYRTQGEDKNNREAEGRSTNSVWVPYKLNGEIQDTLRISLTREPLDFSFIDVLEADYNQLITYSQPIENLDQYSITQSFTQTGDIQNIDAALLNQDAGDTPVVSHKGWHLDSQREQNIPAMYLVQQDEYFIARILDDEGNGYAHVKISLSTQSGKKIELVSDKEGLVKTQIDDNDLIEPQSVEIVGDDIIFESDITTKVFESIECVKGIQERCNNLGFDAGMADGVLGKKTKSALADFQAAFGIPITGEADTQTKDKMKKVFQQ